MKRVDVKLTYESLIALLQGKEFHLHYGVPHTTIVFHPPFDGVFLTHQQIADIKYHTTMDTLNMIQKLQEHHEERE